MINSCWCAFPPTPATATGTSSSQLTFIALLYFLLLVRWVALFWNHYEELLKRVWMDDEEDEAQTSRRLFDSIQLKSSWFHRSNYFFKNLSVQLSWNYCASEQRGNIFVQKKFGICSTCPKTVLVFEQLQYLKSWILIKTLITSTV